eukprot:gnl/TRDRNA2_/TRDRNA2_165511_c0_seq1.p1 gnl/TRDRNA2_/TRDRNA2_165511_c0~~gnl/TRDRNA2_/TRDRNA2_165511_c0_seq1.p1  ORF type:complete len:112 (+),score=14.47 gnl/TRDRNA2_/TRDRNA2_165511_c0_seq1:83-418(+)
MPCRECGKWTQNPVWVIEDQPLPLQVSLGLLHDSKDSSGLTGLANSSDAPRKVRGDKCKNFQFYRVRSDGVILTCRCKVCHLLLELRQHIVAARSVYKPAVEAGPVSDGCE